MSIFYPVGWPPRMPSWLSRNIALRTVRLPISVRIPAPLPSGTRMLRNTRPSTTDDNPRSTSTALPSHASPSKTAVPGWTALKVMLPPACTVHWWYTPGAIRIVAVPFRIDCTASSRLAKPWPVSCTVNGALADCAASGAAGASVKGNRAIRTRRIGKLLAPRLSAWATRQHPDSTLIAVRPVSGLFIGAVTFCSDSSPTAGAVPDVRHRQPSPPTRRGRPDRRRDTSEGGRNGRHADGWRRVSPAYPARQAGRHAAHPFRAGRPLSVSVAHGVGPQRDGGDRASILRRNGRARAATVGVCREMAQPDRDRGELVGVSRRAARRVRRTRRSQRARERPALPASGRSRRDAERPNRSVDLDQSRFGRSQRLTVSMSAPRRAA